MSNKIFEQLFIEQIEIFKNSFDNVSQKVFYDENKKQLIHAGEFGMYREAVCRNFLRFFMPYSLESNTGFIINTADEISTQCDIIVYDPKITPLVQSNDLQRFFPVESIAAIGEVKSDLDRTKLKEALNKLARIKMMRCNKSYEKATVISRRGDRSSYDPDSCSLDQLFSFLICKKLDFKLDNIVNEIDGFYDSDIPFRYRHNLILSIDDGLIAYCDKDAINAPYPCNKDENFKNCIIWPGESRMEHMKLFSHLFFLGVSYSTILYPEILYYMKESELQRRRQG